MVRRGPRICFLDVESSGLEADVGLIVGVGFMDLEGRFKWLYADEPAREREVLKKALEHLSTHHVFVTWNGGRFDVPFLYSRAIKLRLSLEGIIKSIHFDLAEFIRGHLKLSRMDLYHVAKFLGIRKNISVEGIDVPSLYHEALRGNRRAASRIRNHCRDDLETTRRIFLRVLPMVRAMKPELAL